MATASAIVPPITLLAAGDLSSAQYRFGVLSSGNVAQSGVGASNDPIGVIQNAPDAAGKATTVRVLGESLCVAGAAITVGAKVTSDANGKAVTATTGDHVAGIAMTGASADLVVFKVFLKSSHIL